MTYDGQQYRPPYGTTEGQQGGSKEGKSPSLTMVAVILVIIGIGAAFAFIYFISTIGSEPWEEDRDFHSDVYIEEGGHFRFLVTESWEERVEANITVSTLEGGYFDLYIMDADQYDNAYGNSSTGSFSAIHSFQNVSAQHVSFELVNTRTIYYLVIDNSDMPHVPGSTSPAGHISVDADIHITYFYDAVW